MLFQALSSVQEWMRVSSILDHSRLISRHVVFAYYYVNALFNRRLYSEIPTVPVGHLVCEMFNYSSLHCYCLVFS